MKSKKDKIIETEIDVNKNDELNFRSILELLLLIIVVVFLLKSCVLDFFNVSSGSMEPILQKNDYIVVSRVAYFIGLSNKLPILNLRINNNLKLWYKTPKKGDIIMVDNNIPSLAKYNEKFLVKRITAAPGDLIYYQSDIFSNISYSIERSNDLSERYHKIIIPRSGETVVVNLFNYHFYEKLIKNEGGTLEFRGHELYINNVFTNKYKFKYNHYFVTGDNQLNSFDSRVFGLIPETAIQGKALFIYWSNYSGKSGLFDRVLKWLK